jgi:hypothetical protein
MNNENEKHDDDDDDGDDDDAPSTKFETQFSLFDMCQYFGGPAAPVFRE